MLRISWTNLSLPHMQMSVPFFWCFLFLFSTIIQNVKALLTIGGWDNSIYWSSSVATPQNRSVFAHNVAQIARVHKLDGVDFE